MRVKVHVAIPMGGGEIEEYDGWLLGWGLDVEEYRDGPASYSVGLVGDLDGKIRLVHPSFITIKDVTSRYDSWV